MNILLLSLLLFSSSVFACGFSGPVKRVYSLSGPVTLALKKLQLLGQPQLVGISIFHPISKDEFKGEVLPGGIFLSQDKLTELAGAVIFFDESQELRKIFRTQKNATAVEIKSRGKTPLQVIEQLQKDLKGFLSGCDLSLLKKTMEKELKELKSLVKKKTYLFFLGMIRGKRMPEMLMVNDGIVKWLREENLIATYPSELAYVNWSSRILSTMDKDHVKIGIRDSGRVGEKKIVKEDGVVNLTWPGSLIPGFGQVEAFIELFKGL